jgi:hypothetical protein
MQKFLTLICLLCFTVILRAADVAVTALASLTDPAKLGTLQSPRAANDRLLKCIYWLDDARSRGLEPEAVITEAQAQTNPRAEHAALVKASLLRNLDIAGKLGCLTPENAEKMRRGYSPTVTRGPYRDEPAEIDHIVPVALAPELGNEIANLELMPRTLNRRKGTKIRARQMDQARKLLAVGVLDPATFRRLR